MLHRPLKPLPPRRIFLRHLAVGALRGAVLIGFGLGLGMLGYHYLVGLPWLDAMLNAAMLLGGEGPLAPTPTAAGKWFATFYALFSGLLFVTVTALFLAPAFQRLLHRFHLEATVLPDDHRELAQPGAAHEPAGLEK
jgi:hypothetical protein